MNITHKPTLVETVAVPHSRQSPDNGYKFVQIAVGGTGKTALLQQEESPWITQTDNIRILYLDTDPAELAHIPAKRKFLMTDFPADRYFSELATNPGRFPHTDLFPHVAQFQKALGRSMDISTGLMTNRILGRPTLDYFATSSFPELMAYVLEPVKDLHAYTSDPCKLDFQGHIQERQRLIVTIVASICGGTGSSVGELLAHLVDFGLMHQGGFTRYHIEADLFMPGVLESTAITPDILGANAYATMEGKLKASTQKLPDYKLGPVTLKHDHPPKYLYVFDNINAVGEVLKTKKQVTQMRNETWELRSLGITGEEYRSRITDIPLEAPAFYSAAGAAILEHDVKHSLNILGYRTGTAVAQKLVASLPEGELHQQVTHRWDELGHRGSPLRLLPALQSQVDGSPLQVDLKPVLENERQRVGRAMHHLIRQTYRAWQPAFAHLITQEVSVRKELLIKEMMEQLNLPGGFGVACGLLEQLRQFWERESKTLDMTIISRNDALRRQRHALQQQPTRVWQRLKWNPRGAYLRKYQQFVDSQLDMVRQQAKVQIAKKVLETLAEVEKQVQLLQSTLQFLPNRLEAEQNAYIRDYTLRKSVAVHSVMCEDKLNQCYEANAKQACQQVCADVRIVWFADNGTFGLEHRTSTPQGAGRVPILSADGIARHLECAQTPWQHIREYTVETILQERGASPAEIYAELERLSAPWVSLNAVKVIPAHKRLMILASETAGFFEQLPHYRGLSVVATGDPYRMSMLTTWHGIDPLEHLTKSEDYKRAYEQAIASGRSLHLFPELQSSALPAVPTSQPEPPTAQGYSGYDDDIPF